MHLEISWVTADLVVSVVFTRISKVWVKFSGRGITNNMAFYLGLFGGAGPNPAAVLMEDGEVIAFGEEERFSRIKNAPNALPIESILYCLKQARIQLKDVKATGFGWDCPSYIANQPQFLANLAARYPNSDNSYNQIHESRLISSFNPIRIKNDLRFGLAKAGEIFDEEKLVFLKHHLCHAASALFSSGFNEASILTLDGSGEEFTTFLWHGKGLGIKPIKHFEMPDSLGGYYATFTEYLGFKSDSEEGKLMGLAPYGAYSEEIQAKLDRVLNFDRANGDFSVALDMRFFGRRTYNQKFTDALVQLFGAPRLPRDSIDDRHKDIAFNVQWRLEQVVLLLCRRLIRETGCPDLCLSGGVAMNCKMNGFLASQPEVRRIFAQPASSDNGTALGAAMLCARANGVTTFKPMTHGYLGVGFESDQIQRALDESKMAYRKSTDLIGECADMLASGKILGWFQGRSEVGARALGSRSILASPIFSNMRDKLNKEVKHRESWRPFCPSLPVEDFPTYFGDIHHTSDYMILAFSVLEKFRNVIPAAVHVDGTARPQTVQKTTNLRFHTLLKAFGERTGHPILINTSFNIQGEPIVNSPEHALRCYAGTGIDVLAMGDFILEKAP